MEITSHLTELTALIAASPLYREQGTVFAREAVAGESIITTLSDGRIETENRAHAGDFVVTGSEGEQYIVSAGTFHARHGTTDVPGIFSAMGTCRAIQNPFNDTIELLAPWGTIQRGNSECMIAIACDDTGRLTGKPYLIDKKAFAERYAVVYLMH